MLTAILALVQSAKDQRIGLVSIKCVDWTRSLVIPLRWRFNESRERVESYLSGVFEVPGFFSCTLDRYSMDERSLRNCMRRLRWPEVRTTSEPTKGVVPGPGIAPRFVHYRTNLTNKITNFISNPALYRNQTDSILRVAKGVYLLQMSVCSVADLCIFDGLCLQNARFIVVDS